MTRRGAAGLIAAVLLLAAALPAGGQATDEEPAREAYIAHPEFRPYPEQEQLAVEGVTLIRVRRPDQSEALVAREDPGWEHVVREGFRLTCYRQARHPLRPMPGRPAKASAPTPPRPDFATSCHT